MIFALGHITKGGVFRYLVMPEIRPRLQQFFSSGFQHVAFFMALVYRLVRLLPEGHAYTNPSNMGRFGVRHVIAEAANHLVFSWRNMDQILLFFLLLAGVVIMIIQLCSFLFMLAFPSVMAAMPTSLAGFFDTPAPELDIAFMFMDLVFGIPDIFGSCVATGASCIDLQGEVYNSDAIHVSTFLGGLDPSSTVPFAIHEGLHAILRLYSYGLLVIAMMITMYFLFVIVAETAQTGTAFGKRFNKVWAPLRIVMAFGLLIPFGSHGLNTSQYLVLYAAKYGSGFATNGWILFNDSLVSGYVDDTKELVAKPNLPEMGSLMQFLFVAHACKEYYKGASALPEVIDKRAKGEPKVYLVKSPFYATNHLEVTDATTYTQVLDFADTDAQVTMRFGYYNETDNASEKGFVAPLCGEMSFDISDPKDRGLSPKKGSTVMEKGYWKIVKTMYFHNFEALGYTAEYADFYGKLDSSALVPWIPSNFSKNLLSGLDSELQNMLKDAVATEASSTVWEERRNALESRGWAGAAIWYNSIAEMNGRLTTAVLNVPTPVLYPIVSEKVATENRAQNSSTVPTRRFDPGGLSSRDEFNAADGRAAEVFWFAYAYWNTSAAVGTTHTKPTGNMIVDILNAIFGTKGLFDMRKNKDIHPLAQISALGRGLIDAAVQNIGLAMIGGIGGVLATTFEAYSLGQLASVFASFMVSITTVIVTIGWLLFYVVPFLPFVYFYFAVAGWVKGIFEAMVGAPLWALAHIRIDGDGMMGKPAEVGYALIFEIFIRPILIVFGLLAGIMVFAAMVQMLNEIFELVSSNVGGGDGGDSTATVIDMEFFRGPLDEFMYTVMYAIIVYLMAMSSFKMIDTIPNQILRWLGRSDKAFNEEREDAAQGLMGTAFMGGQQSLRAIGGGLGKVAGGLAASPRQSGG